MEEKTETAVGSRKVGQDKYNAWMMILGLFMILVACVLEKTIVTIGIGLAGCLMGGLGFKSDSFNRANAKEHQAKSAVKSLLVLLLIGGAHLGFERTAYAVETGTIVDGKALYWEPTQADVDKDHRRIKWQMNKYKAAKDAANYDEARKFSLWNFQKAWLFNNEVYTAIQANHLKWKTKEDVNDLLALLEQGEAAAEAETIEKYKASAAEALVKIESNRKYLRDVLKAFE